MRNWILRHRWLTGIVVVLGCICITVLLCFSYIWSKLSLIQYDTGSRDAPRYTMEETSLANETIAWETTPNIEPDTTPEPETVLLLPEEEIVTLPEQTTEPALPDIPIWQDADVLNVLLIGTDERSEAFSENARSDSMILVSIHKSTKQIKLVSLERAIGVPVLAGEYQGQYDWLTHIFRYGGADLLLQTVQTCFSVDVTHYVRVNFATFMNAIDAIGGVDIELTQAEADFLNDLDAAYMWLGRERRSVTTGLNHIDGVTALTYARTRSIDSDWQRVERQRKVIIAAIDRLQSSGFAQIDTVADSVLPLIQTNFTQLELAALLLYMPTFAHATVEQMTLPQKGNYGTMIGMGGRTLYSIDFAENAQVLQAFLYGETVK